MRNNVILFSSFLIVSSSVLAEQGLVEGAAKQLAKDAVTSAAPEAVKSATQASESLEQANDLKESVVNAPDAVKERAQDMAKDAAMQQLKEATPEEVKQGIGAVESGKETAEKLKGQVDSVPKSPDDVTKAIESKAQEKATERALDLLR
ncbi:MAG: hypothetical protein ABFS02_10540 [Pseudomonadota bacterium]